MLQQPSGEPTAISRWTGWSKSWPSLHRFASGLHAARSKNNLDSTTFLDKTEDRKCEKYWTLPGHYLSTGFAESPVNEVIAKRMAKKQQMRWTRRTVQRFLDFRIHVLNGTLEDAFRHWHEGFRSVAHQTQLAL
jgi:hypothetical protein